MFHIKANLFDDKGTWSVRARVPNPITGKTTQRSKSTGLKVSGNNKRKAEEKMRKIVAEWEIEANTGVISGRNPPFGECVEHEREPIRAAVTLALVYGLRRSEICGLRWKDIDLDAGVLSVRNTYTEYSGKQLEAKTTKSRASRRDIYLTGDTVDYLRELRERQLSQGFTLDKVCLHENGRTVKPEYLTRMIKAVLVKNGFENVRLHDLRHTAATMLARRLPVKQVQAFLGHEDVSTTLNIYTHITDADKISTAQTMSAILESLKPCSEKCSESQNKGKTAPSTEQGKTA